MPDVFVTKEDFPKKESQKKLIPGHTHNPLAAYCYFPDNIKFVSKDKEERIVLFLRKHPITNLRWIFIATLMFLAPMVLQVFPIPSFMPANFQFILVLFWYLVSTAFAFESFLDWFFSVYIITDERIFDVDFTNLIYREISEANLDQIQDVTVTMGGVIRTMFNYGDIFIQTSGEVPRLEFEAVPYPDKVAKTLRELRVEEETEKLEGRVR